MTDALQKYVCIRVLVDGEREQAVHVTSVPFCDYEASQAEVARLRTELAAVREDAVETVQFWSDYVSEYFRDKHDLKTDIERLRGAVTRRAKP